MSRKILFFINPVSGTKSKLSLEKTIIRKCGEKNIAFEILFTSATGDYKFLRDKIEKDLITDVVICGGDGSISPVIASLLNIPIRIGILPLGSGNGLARTAGIPKSIDKAFEIIFNGKASCVDAFLINNRLSCHVCGLGFDAKVAYDFSTRKRRGLATYTLLAIKSFFSAGTYSFDVETQNDHFKAEAYLLCIANSNQFGNNFKIAPQASLTDALLDIVVLKKTTKMKILISFVRQIRAGKIKSINAEDFQQERILYFQTPVIKIKNPEMAPLHIDGDPAPTSKEFLIEILPAAYTLIQP